MAEFRVPRARGPDGALVSPSEAQKGVEYRCPNCGTDLTFRKGQVRRPHFAHRAVASSICSPERVELSLAKQALIDAVHRWRHEGAPAPRTQRYCSACGRNIVQELSGIVTHAVPDHDLDAGEARVHADVALIGDARVVGLIGIRSSARSGTGRFADVRLPWMELDARDVLRAPSMWNPVSSGNTKTVRCKPECAPAPRPAAAPRGPGGETRPRASRAPATPGRRLLSEREALLRVERRRKRRLRFFAFRQGIALPVDGYIAYLQRCDGCHRWVLFFRPLPTSTGTPPSPPPPPPARTAWNESREWSNVCPYCEHADLVAYAGPRPRVPTSR